MTSKGIANKSNYKWIGVCQQAGRQAVAVERGSAASFSTVAGDERLYKALQPYG